MPARVLLFMNHFKCVTLEEDFQVSLNLKDTKGDYLITKKLGEINFPKYI